jgi:hypothetical protein
MRLGLDWMLVCEITGMLFGKKNIYYKGLMRFMDIQNKLKATIVFHQKKKADEFEDLIWLKYGDLVKSEDWKIALFKP